MSSDFSRLLHAASFAAARHRDQRRKDVAASPYINHPLEVTAVLAGPGAVTDAELLVAALLHDTVEDTDTTLDEIGQRFGSLVQSIVSEVTDDKRLEKAERKRLQVETAPHKSDRAKQLRIADKICNIRDMDDKSPAAWSHDRKVEYLAWAEDVVAGCRGVNASLESQFDEALEQVRGRLSGD